MPLWRINCMTVVDLDHILAIERQSFSLPWSYQLFLSELECEHAVADTVHAYQLGADVLIAYMCCRLILDELHILRLAVDPLWRCQGVASWLLERSCQKACLKGVVASYLEVRSSNQPAIAFYRKAGFQAIGVRQRYYSETGDDALIFQKHL